MRNLAADTRKLPGLLNVLLADPCGISYEENIVPASERPALWCNNSEKKSLIILSS